MPNNIGRYQIKSKLGQGGMASVYHAIDPAFQREVAIKVLPPEFLRDPTLRARFEREARMIAGLEHPAIVPVYDVGEEAEQPYLVMRYMPGGALSDRLENGPIPINDIARIIQRIGSALDKAHERGIIHRDLKPGNILFDQYGDAYLSDFGIARSVESQGTLTGYGGAIGTPGYMSPEQIQGDPLDNRSDIYALGIVVFEMLTGTNPFRSTSPAMSMVKQMTEALPSINQVKPDLPPEVDAVIRQATAREPDDRTPTAAEVARLLAEAMAIAIKLITPPEPPPTRPQAQPDKTVLSPHPPVLAARSRNTTWLIAGATIILILAFVGYFAFTSSRESQPDVSAASSSGAEFETVVPIDPTNTPIAPATRKPQPQPTNTPPLAATSPPINPTPAVRLEPDPDSTLYDNFDDPTYDGTVNRQLWYTGSDTPLECKMRQENGLIITTNEPRNEEVVCWVGIPQVRPGRELETLSARMKIAGDHTGYVTSVLRQLTNFNTAGNEYYEIRCGIDNMATGVPGAVIGFTIYDTRRTGDTRPYYTTHPIDYDRWYNVSLVVDPHTMTFSCLVDGEKIGSHSPKNVEELQNTIFGWRGLLEARAPGAMATTYIDDIRIEPID